jgi:hypothetical protein
MSESIQEILSWPKISYVPKTNIESKEIGWCHMLCCMNRQHRKLLSHYDFELIQKRKFFIHILNIMMYIMHVIEMFNPRTVSSFYHTKGVMWVQWDPHVNKLRELDFFCLFCAEDDESKPISWFFRSADTSVW